MARRSRSNRTRWEARLSDRRIQGDPRELPAPAVLKARYPLTRIMAETVLRARGDIERILRGEDDRLLAIVGPCSVHKPDEAVEYAAKLAKIRQQFKKLLVVVRVYYSKPRTTIGWKGLLQDPHLDGTERIDLGLEICMKLLSDITALGMPVGAEFLGTIDPQYLANWISWACIGARTAEGQPHRELVSGLSMPVGIKNSTGGNIQIAMDGVEAARHPHSFISIDNQTGKVALINTTGHDACHVVLRGGSQGSNFDEATIQATIDELIRRKLTPKLMVDCSHANSKKDHTRQAEVCKNVVQQRVGGQMGIMGIMLESNLVPGRQDMKQAHLLTHGQSITDACIGWEETVQLLEYADRILS